MTEPKDGPWRANVHYLHSHALRDKKQQPLIEVVQKNEGTFPKQLDWASPSKEQQTWMQKILAHIPEASFNIFQEYGLTRKNGEVVLMNYTYADRKIRLATEMSGRGSHPGESPLYPIFGQEFADYFNRPNGKWHMFLYAKEDKGVAKVIGGGKMHVCDMGRTYWNGLSMSFDDIGEARTFLDTVKEQPRPGLELYLRTLFGDKFPRGHYDGRKLGSGDRVIFYPFDEIHGPLEISTKDLTLSSEIK